MTPSSSVCQATLPALTVFRPVTNHSGPSRAEFDRLSKDFLVLAERQSATQQELAIQFQRIADLQAELDTIRGAWAKLKLARGHGS